MPLFSTKTTPLDNLDMNELNIFLNTIRPSIKKTLRLDRIVTAIALIKGLEKEENAMRASMNEKNEDLRLAATLEDKKKLTEEREQIRSKMKANQVEIDRRKQIINDEKKKFYKDNKQIIDEKLAESSRTKDFHLSEMRRKASFEKAKAEALKKVKMENAARLQVTTAALNILAKKEKSKMSSKKSSKKSSVKSSEKTAKKSLTASQRRAHSQAIASAVRSQIEQEERELSAKAKTVAVPPKKKKSTHRAILDAMGTSTAFGKSKKKKRGQSKKNKRKHSKKARR